jgi:hypothetical protein
MTAAVAKPGIAMVLAQARPTTLRETVVTHVIVAAMTAHTPGVHSGILDTYKHRCAAAEISVAKGALPGGHEVVDVFVV